MQVSPPVVLQTEKYGLLVKILNEAQTNLDSHSRSQSKFPNQNLFCTNHCHNTPCTHCRCCQSRKMENCRILHLLFHKLRKRSVEKKVKEKLQLTRFNIFIARTRANTPTRICPAPIIAIIFHTIMVGIAKVGKGEIASFSTSCLAI